MRWQRLVRYLRTCVEAEATGELVAHASSSWSVWPGTTAAPLVFPSDEVELSPRLESFVRDLPPGREIRFGWPTLVVRDGQDVPRILPLFVIGLDRPGPETLTTGAAEDEAYLNPAVIGSGYFPADALAAVDDLTASGVPQDDYSVLTRLGQAVVEALGYDSAGLDAAHLTPDQPLRRVNNIGSLVAIDASQYTRSLVKELKELESRTDWHETAAAALVTGKPPADRSTTVLPLVPLAVNPAQGDAVDSIRRCGLSVITGPPGTGKSQVLAAAAANAWSDRQTMLVTSTNNGAVDVAVERTTALDPALVIRTGNRNVRDALPEVLANAVAHPRVDDVDEASARQRFRDAREVLDRLVADLDLRVKVQADLATGYRDIEPLCQTLWGFHRPAIEPELQADLRRRGTRAARLRILRRLRLGRIRKRFRIRETATPAQIAEWSELSQRLKRLEIEDRRMGDRLGDDDALPAAEDEVQESSRALLLSIVARTIAAHRGTLASVQTAAFGGPGFALRLAKARDAIPVLACTTLAMGSNCELRPGLFDVAVIDEASQCTLAAVLPIAFRAKRLAVIGDPNQLRPVVTVPIRRSRQLAMAANLDPFELQAAGLEHGSGSAYLAFEHVANTAGHSEVLLLDEHFRSHPSIARWFNQVFYDSSLHVLTDVREMMGTKRGLQWIDVNGVSERGEGGGARNRIEAEAVVDWLATNAQPDLSFGVVTPFAYQARTIRRLVTERLGKEGSRNIEVATSHRFQGRECDVVLFSTVLAPNSSPHTARWVQQERNLINVAASRARRLLVVFGHPDPAVRSAVPALESLRRAAVEGLPTPSDAGTVHSVAEDRLIDALGAVGIVPVLKPVVEGYELDLELIARDGARIDIEVDGRHHYATPSGRLRRQDTTRDRVLRRLGWEVMRIPAWECIARSEEVAERIRRRVEADR